MKRFLLHIFQSIEHILFPPFCLACGESLPKDVSCLCTECFQSLQLLSLEGRCHRCFCPKEEHSSCHNCKNLPSGLYGQATCFEASAVTTALFSELRYGRCIKAFTSFLVVQLDALHWPLPDVIVPTPGDWFDTQEEWLIRKIVAKELSTIIQKPYSNCLSLQRHLLPLRYASLESQPLTGEETECLSCSKDIINKHILLIHDTYTTGAAIVLSSQKLLSSGALSVRALSCVTDPYSPFTG